MRACLHFFVLPSLNLSLCVACAVAEAAVRAGADMVNDVSGGGHDRDMLATVGGV